MPLLLRYIADISRRYCRAMPRRYADKRAADSLPALYAAFSPCCRHAAAILPFYAADAIDYAC